MSDFTVEFNCITFLMLVERPYTTNTLSTREAPCKGGVRKPAALLFYIKAATPSGLQWCSLSLGLHNLGDLDGSKQMEMITWGADVVVLLAS